MKLNYKVQKIVSEGLGTSKMNGHGLEQLKVENAKLLADNALLHE